MEIITALIAFFFIVGFVRLLKSTSGGRTWREYEFDVLRPISPDEWKALAPAEQQAKMDEFARYKRVIKRTR